MKFVDLHPFADPDAAARKLIEIANGVEAVQDGRIYIERVNEPFLAAGGSGEQFRAGIERAIALGWLLRHESGTYVHRQQCGIVCLFRNRNHHPRRGCRQMWSRNESPRRDFSLRDRRSPLPTTAHVADSQRSSRTRCSKNSVCEDSQRRRSRLQGNVAPRGRG
jgi:hypothetical protein